MSDQAPLASLLEALLFVSARPVPAHRLAEVVGRPVEEVRAALEALRAEWAATGRGVQLQAVAGDAFQMVANPQYADYIRRLQGPLRVDDLSRALWETAAVVAYHQPVTLAEITHWRGVDSSRALRTLLRMGWVRVVGRKAAPGRPRMYGVSDAFWQALGLSGAEALPPWQAFIPDAHEDVSVE
ncbi:Segregation and condensation protein B [bacterium HR11]|nr:Segregation and condensation protein B [bacterium HR11]